MFSPEWSPSKPLFSFDSPKRASKTSSNSSSVAADDLKQEHQASFLWGEDDLPFSILNHPDTFTSLSSFNADEDHGKRESSVESDSFWKKHDDIDTAGEIFPSKIEGLSFQD